MKVVAIVIGFLAMTFGLVATCQPQSVITIAYHMLTPSVLYTRAAVRIGIGLLLVAVASASRMKKTIRGLGMIVLLAGMATPIVGVDHARAVLDWCAREGAWPLRVSGCVAFCIGAFIVYAFSPWRLTRRCS